MTPSRSKPLLVIVRRVLLNADGTFGGDYVTVAECLMGKGEMMILRNETAPLTEREARCMIEKSMTHHYAKVNQKRTTPDMHCTEL